MSLEDRNLLFFLILLSGKSLNKYLFEGLIFKKSAIHISTYCGLDYFVLK